MSLVPEVYDLTQEDCDPAAVERLLRRAAGKARERRHLRRRARWVLKAAGLCLGTAVLLALSGYAPETEADPAAVPVFVAVSSASSEPETGRRPGCHTFMILCRDREARVLGSVVVGMLDKEQGRLSILSVPIGLSVDMNGTRRTLSEVYADGGALGVKAQMARLLGYGVDHYVSLSDETALAVRERMAGRPVVTLPGEEAAAWEQILGEIPSVGYVRNLGVVIGLLETESVMSLSGENLRWYAGELIRLGGKLERHGFPAEELPDGALAVDKEAWLRLINDAFCPFYDPITKENIRVTAAEEEKASAEPARRYING